MTLDLTPYKQLFAELAKNPNTQLQIEASMNYWVEVSTPEALQALLNGTRIRAKSVQTISNFLVLATIEDAPAVLNTNDKAMWVLGFNEGADATIKRLSAGVSVEPSHYNVGGVFIEAFDRDQLTTAIAAARVQMNERLAKHFDAKPGCEMFGGGIADEIRALLGMEEEGDPVEGVAKLIEEIEHLRALTRTYEAALKGEL